MKLYSPRGLPVLTVGAVVALALLVSPPAMAEDANPAATEDAQAAAVLDGETPVVPPAAPVEAPVSEESVSVMPPAPSPTTTTTTATTATATSPIAPSVDESDSAAFDASEASESPKASPDDEPVDRPASEAEREANAEVDSAPPARFAPFIASRQFLDGETAAVKVNFECYSDPDVSVARCYLFDHLGVERLRGEVMKLPVGTYTWVGTAETASGERYPTDITFTVEARDVSAPVLNLDRPEGITPWSNVPTGVVTAEDPESGIEYIQVSWDGGPWELWRGDRYDYSLADGVRTLQFRARNNHGLETESDVLTLRIDTVAPLLSVQPFGTVVPDDAGQAFGSAARATHVEVEYGSTVALDYECYDERSGLASCSSPVPTGGLLDTSSVGEHVVTVTAVDEAGNRSDEVVRYFVVGGPTPQEGSGSPVVTDQGGQRPAVSGAVRRSVAGAVDTDSLAATGANPWQVAVGSMLAVVLMGGGALLLLRRRSTI